MSVVHTFNDTQKGVTQVKKRLRTPGLDNDTTKLKSRRTDKHNPENKAKSLHEKVTKKDKQERYFVAKILT